MTTSREYEEAVALSLYVIAMTLANKYDDKNNVSTALDRIEDIFGL